MPVYPKIETPCPVRDRLSEVLDGDFCRECKERVTDLTGMSDEERIAFMANRTGKVCVMYRRPIKPVLAAAALAAVAMPMAAAAQDAPPPAAEEVVAGGAGAEMEIIVGGIGARKDGSPSEGEDKADAALPDLPVIDGDTIPAS
jgi:hypothetical protein